MESQAEEADTTTRPLIRCPKCYTLLRMGETWKLPSLRWVCDGLDCGYDAPLGGLLE